MTLRCFQSGMRLAFIGSARFGITEPMAGGMESMLSSLAVAASDLGHAVTVFSGDGDEVGVGPAGVTTIPLTETTFVPSVHARADVSMPPERFMAEHDAYLGLGHRLRDGDFDVVHNHSLHYLPPLYDIATPMVHTLHSPPTPWLESAHRRRTRSEDLVVSVSEANARLWGDLVDLTIPNGVDLATWGAAAGGLKSDGVVWSGRIVPEKGPHLALDAARLAGRSIQLAGPVHDADYFRCEIEPRLGPQATYLGHLDNRCLARLVASAAAAVVTPMWDEPFGLVVAEALAAGTPVAAFARGAMGEVLDEASGALAQPGDAASLAAAIGRAARLDPEACRRRAAERWSASAMAERYVEAYELVARARDGAR